MKDGRTKGANFENDICRMLSVWLCGSEYADALVTQLPFRRRFTSTTPLDGHWNGEGDILHKPGINFPFCVECKNQEGWELDGIMANKSWPPWLWWAQAQRQAEAVKLYPLMFFTRNRRKTLVMLEEGVSQCLRLNPRSGVLLLVDSQKRSQVVIGSAESLLSVKRERISGLRK